MGDVETSSGDSGIDEGELVMVTQLDVILGLRGMVSCWAMAECMWCQCCRHVL